ncbi:hypothetical protein [Bacillus stratosphericus]|uniref:hypothetical protein n=1 Tax=Bacillus stratosphericus TaxID=293386 RepID=UPI001CFA0889|nr:hypothetical protein [Bacillus stratosphericus]
MAKRFCKPFILLLTAVLLVTFVAPQISHASEFPNSQVISYSDYGNYSEKEIEEVLKFYFEEVGELTDEGYVIKNNELFDAKVLAGDSAALKLKELIALDSSFQKSGFQVASATTFGKCVVNKMIGSYGNIARQFLNGAIFTYIKTKQYDLAAKLIFNTLVKSGMKVNAASLAIELGYYGWKCRGKW